METNDIVLNMLGLLVGVVSLVALALTVLLVVQVYKTEEKRHPHNG